MCWQTGSRSGSWELGCGIGDGSSSDLAGGQGNTAVETAKQAATVRGQGDTVDTLMSWWVCRSNITLLLHDASFLALVVVNSMQ